MAESASGPDKAATIELLKAVMGLWTGRRQRKAAEEAGKIRFWEDGMLEHLRLIAEGKEKKNTFRELNAKLNESEDDVFAALHMMKKIRNKLGGGSVARAIDNVLNNRAYGKRTIRENIRCLLDEELTKAEKKFRAGEICNQIEALNAGLDRLQRLVDD